MYLLKVYYYRFDHLKHEHKYFLYMCGSDMWHAYKFMAEHGYGILCCFVLISTTTGTINSLLLLLIYILDH